MNVYIHTYKIKLILFKKVLQIYNVYSDKRKIMPQISLCKTINYRIIKIHLALQV